MTLGALCAQCNSSPEIVKQVITDKRLYLTSYEVVCIRCGKKLRVYELKEKKDPTLKV